MLRHKNKKNNIDISDKPHPIQSGYLSKVLRFLNFCCYLVLIRAPALTFEGQVAKESRQEVHRVHDKDGDVGHLLHSLLGWTEISQRFHKLKTFSGSATSEFKAVRWSVDSLAELSVDGKNLRVAHKGEGEDGNSVRRLPGDMEK